MTAAARVPLERLAAELRDVSRQRQELMRAAGTVPTLPERVSAVMDHYDRLLMEAAEMLEVDIPADARSPVDPSRLTHLGRVALEQALVAAGLHVAPEGPR
jgi:hypothetical protein